MQESEKPLQFQRNGKNKKYKKISIAWYHILFQKNQLFYRKKSNF